MTIDDTLEERGSRYGDFDGHAEVTVALKDIVRDAKNWHRMSSSQQEAIDMIFHKIGRIVNGDPFYKDSWTDIIGYARLVEKTLGD